MKRPSGYTAEKFAESTPSYSKVSEDTAPTTLAAGKSPASVDNSNETHSDSPIDTVMAATRAGECDSVCCECYVDKASNGIQCGCKGGCMWTASVKLLLTVTVTLECAQIVFCKLLHDA